jgi:hypothetical protein
MKFKQHVKLNNLRLLLRILLFLHLCDLVLMDASVTILSTVQIPLVIHLARIIIS